MAGEKKTSELTLDSTPGAGSYVPYVDPTEAADADKNKRILFSDVDSAAGLVIGTDVQAHSAVLDATTASFTTADETKLDGIETAATADQSGSEIKALYEAVADTNAFTDSLQTKLDGIEALADVTDAANVAAAGAPIITSGAGAPSSTPAAVGDIYVDTTGDNVYSAAGTASSADWKQATGAGGGDLLAANNLSDLANAATGRTNLGVVIGTDVQAHSAVLDATTASFTSTLSGNITTNNAKVSNATHTGDVTGATALTIAANAVTASTIAAAAVTSAKLANMAQSTVKGRAAAAGTGVPVDLTATELRTIINVEDGADVTDTANVTAAGALMDSEVDADIKTLSLPASTTISAFGATLVDDADAATARTTIGAAAGYPVPVDVVGTTDTLAAADHGITNRYTNAAAVTVTIPTDAADDLPDGFWCLLFAEGAGGVTLSTTGVTLAGSSPNTTIAQNEGMIVQKTGTANTWIVLGATAA